MPLPREAELFFGLELTPEQKFYADTIFDKRLTIVNAISGSGKTTVGVGCAKLLKKDLVYIFAPVEEGKMGFRKGTQQEKESVYVQPLVDALLEIGENPLQAIYNEDIMSDAYFNKTLKKAKAKKGDNDIMKDVWVFPKPHVFARGTNIKDKVVIIDEAQNFTVPELRKVLTRIHDNCHVIMIGHTGQCDLANPKLSGFKPYIDYYATKPYAQYCELTKNFRGELATDADLLEWKM